MIFSLIQRPEIYILKYEIRYWKIRKKFGEFKFIKVSKESSGLKTTAFSTQCQFGHPKNRVPPVPGKTQP